MAILLTMVPGNTPDALLAAVQKAVLQELAQPASRERRAGLDLSYEALTGVATSKRLSDLSARYAKIAKSHADGFTTCGIRGIVLPTSTAPAPSRWSVQSL